MLDALRSAINVVNDDVAGADVPPRGVAIIFLRERVHPGPPTLINENESWIVAGMNTFEAVGVLTMAAGDINVCGLDGNVDCSIGPTSPDEPA